MIDHLSSTTRQLIRAVTADELSHAASAGLDTLLDADQVTVIPAADCGGDTQVWASTGTLDIPAQRPLISGIIGQSYASGESWIVDDLLETRSTSSQSGSVDPLQYRSLLCVPVPDWGALVAIAHDAAAFSDDDRQAVELLGSFVTAAATRIRSADTRPETGDRIQEMASILTHDLRSPLTVAHGQVELAREEHNSEHLAQAASALERLEELIDDVEIYARSGDNIDVTEHVDIQSVAERAWAMIETADAELIVDDSMTVLADESQLCQLLENLFRNAISHGGPAVTVRVGLLAKQTGFYVADDGPGIPAENRETIFEHGYSNGAHGTGLGLFIVENIVDAHGWAITATESAQGGARFNITGLAAR